PPRRGRARRRASARERRSRRRPPAGPPPGARRAAACASRGPLARLPVQRVPAAPAAVLPKVPPVRGVPLRLLRLVVAPLALRAGERDRDSDSGGHLVSCLVGRVRGAR